MRKPLVLAWLVMTAGAVALAQGGAAFDWQLPHNFPAPRVPAGNPMSAPKVELGRFLFYDTRLSGNGAYACATCHEQARAFTDGKGRAVGSTGETHERGAMSLVNIGYAGSLTWMMPGVARLEEQALVPMFGEHPIELGLTQPAAAALAAIRQAAEYKGLFSAAFPGGADPVSIENIARAISAFERTIISARSPYDRYHYDRDDTAVSPAAKRGEQLFFSQPLSCFRCHNGFNFSGETDFEGRRGGEGEGGLRKYKAPTLRNIAMTAPYMQDGSIRTLDSVLDHYAAGDRMADEGAHGFPLSAPQKADVLSFLNALTDTDLLHDPRFADPRKH